MKIKENIKFAITMGLLPWLPAFILYKHHLSKVSIVVLCVFILISLISLISEKFAISIKSTLEKTGEFLGKYIAIIALSIIFILAILPTGLLMKIVKRDRLRLKKPETSTYWINYETTNSDYELQF